MRIYLDNAATTRLDDEVYREMSPYILEHYGNPSSSHQQGRLAKCAIEKARATIAGFLNAYPSEIYFTSGGTEANNTAIFSGIRSLGIKHAITSSLEHHAVLNPLKQLAKNDEIKLSFVAHDESGNISLQNLEQLLQENPRSFVSIMHANNELGNINAIEAISELCEKYAAILHSDTVQTVGHHRYDLKKLNVQFISGSAHKFHGPKGVGFIYVSNKIKVPPLIHGGAQERNGRAGTENVAGIVGLAKAFELAQQNIEENTSYLDGLKLKLIKDLQDLIPDVRFNGNSGDIKRSLPTVLNVSFPKTDKSAYLLSFLDINNISASGGSACNSGSEDISHVLKGLNADPDRAAVRFSFSKYNTPEELDQLRDILLKLYQPGNLAQKQAAY